MELNKNHIENPEGLEQKQHHSGAEKGFDRESAIKELDKHKFDSSAKEGGEADIKPPPTQKKLEFGDAQFDAEAEKSSPEKKEPPAPDCSGENTGQIEAEGRRSQEKGTEVVDTAPPDNPPDVDSEQVDTQGETYKVERQKSVDSPPDGLEPDGKPLNTPVSENENEQKERVPNDLKTLKSEENIGSQVNISDGDINKISNWTYAPDLETYKKHKDVFDNPQYYNQETGEIHWPSNNGFAGEPTPETLSPGTRIDRYGSDYGSFVAPEGTEYGKRSLPPGTENSQYSVFEVIKPLDVQGGQTAPWFDEPGGGIQYKLSMSVDDLIDEGYLRRISKHDY